MLCDCRWKGAPTTCRDCSGISSAVLTRAKTCHLKWAEEVRRIDFVRMASSVPVVVSPEFLDGLDGMKTGLALRAFVGDLAPLQNALIQVETGETKSDESCEVRMTKNTRGFAKSETSSTERDM